MAMVVQHNMQAMNSARMLGITSNAQAKSTEKLSSGYKINRAADDAAGLSISEKMRKQMRGLDRASTNAQDGVSAVQTAEGALTEVHDMLQRMNELAVQASNGTNSQSDRESIQNEVDQLTTEIDRVSETTKFNETYLLKGNADPSQQKDVTLGGHDAGLDKLRSADNYTANVNAQNNASLTTFTFKVDNSKLTAGSKVNIGGKDYTIIEKAADDDAKSYKYKNVTNGVLDTDDSKITGNKALALIHDALAQANKIGDTKNLSGVTEDVPDDLNGKATEDTTYTVKKAQTRVQQALNFDLHVGADADMNNKIGVGIEAMNSKYLGVDKIDVVGKDSTGKENINDGGIAATYAIDAIADAVATHDQQR